MPVYQVMVFLKNGGVVRHDAKFTDVNEAKKFADRLAHSVTIQEVLVYIPIGACANKGVQWTLF